MMEWKKVVEKFLSQFRNKDYYEGAILFGSYANGNNNEFSDIDIRICISDTQTWRERGNVKIDGYLIEYFYSSSF